MPDSSPISSRPRILFFGRSCAMPGMIAAFAARSDAWFCRENPKHAVPEGMRLFTLRDAWRLRRAIRDGAYDLVIACSIPDPIWRQDRNALSNA
jgi:hypothetical protein